MKITDKRIIVSLPLALYRDAKKAAGRRYVSVSALVREALFQKLRGGELESGRLIESGPRIGWEKSFRLMHANKDDKLLVDDALDLDVEHWNW